MTVTTLTYHEFSDCLWVRCASRGCFVNSPALKALADRYLESGGSNIIVDTHFTKHTLIQNLTGILKSDKGK